MIGLCGCDSERKAFTLDRKAQGHFTIVFLGVLSEAHMLYVTYSTRWNKEVSSTCDHVRLSLKHVLQFDIIITATATAAAAY